MPPETLVLRQRLPNSQSAWRSLYVQDEDAARPVIRDTDEVSAKDLCAALST